MRFLSPEEIIENGFSEEYLKLRDISTEYYIYEFMRIGCAITPYDTLGHIGGVHYVAVYAARQLFAAGVPVDVALVSGAAAVHDIGKYGSKKSEERRVPYLHYFLYGSLLSPCRYPRNRSYCGKPLCLGFGTGKLAG